jgi:hypothetical protein
MVRKADPSKRIVLLLNKIGIMSVFVMFKVYSYGGYASLHLNF